MARRKLSIKKQSFDPDKRPETTSEEATPEDATTLQSAIGLRRRLGGAENRSDDEDVALRVEYEAPSEPAPAVEIIEDD